MEDFSYTWREDHLEYHRFGKGQINFIKDLILFSFFQDIFKSNNCRSDYLEIRDGYWHKSPILGRFCGSGKVNELITTTGSRMLLSFVTSQHLNSMRGFAASYEGGYSYFFH